MAGLRWKQTLNSPGPPRGARVLPPPQGAGQRPGTLGPSGSVQSRLGSAFVTCSSAPHGHRCRAAASRGGREAPATAAAAARPPSLPPSCSPSLPLSLPRALPLAGPSRGQPVLDQIQVSPKEREREKDLLCGKERPLTAFIFHALTTGRPPRRRPGRGPAAAGVCGACCLARADRRAPRAARSTLWAAAPRQPRHQTDLKVLPTDSTSGCPPRGWPPPRSPLCSVCGQSPHTIHLVRALAPGRTPLLAKAPAGPHSGRDPAPDRKPPPPARDPHKAQCPPAAPSPQPLLPFTCSQERLHLGAEARPWARAEGAGEPGSRGPREATEDQPG
ncbi:basic proline-rich protein-like [Ursus maritimus]|uniref:Basic proline-rich protein-like n=1 Tax=Ursus maritimus TaxID=29073 RepID=A0A8M1GS09_URSMA|nr:basic proline-rich protein-like [Ursus maritimus]